jgi:hypothetical protein
VSAQELLDSQMVPSLSTGEVNLAAGLVRLALGAGLSLLAINGLFGMVLFLVGIALSLAAGGSVRCKVRNGRATTVRA